jgi:hypothetical protein
LILQGHWLSYRNLTFGHLDKATGISLLNICFKFAIHTAPTGAQASLSHVACAKSSNFWLCNDVEASTAFHACMYTDGQHSYFTAWSSVVLQLIQKIRGRASAQTFEPAPVQLQTPWMGAAVPQQHWNAGQTQAPPPNAWQQQPAAGAFQQQGNATYQNQPQGYSHQAGHQQQQQPYQHGGHQGYQQQQQYQQPPDKTQQGCGSAMEIIVSILKSIFKK